MTHQDAQNALASLNGFIFDEDMPHSSLSIEIARRDLDDNPRHGNASAPRRLAERRPDSGRAMPPSRLVPVTPIAHYSYGLGGGYGMGGGMGGGYASYPREVHVGRGDGGGDRKRSRYDSGNNNDDTICIRMIPQGCQEDTVRSIVENFDGYRGLKLLTNASAGQTLVCFVLFNSSSSAHRAITLLQGQEFVGADGVQSEITVEMARRSLQLD